MRDAPFYGKTHKELQYCHQIHRHSGLRGEDGRICSQSRTNNRLIDPVSQSGTYLLVEVRFLILCGQDLSGLFQQALQRGPYRGHNKNPP